MIELNEKDLEINISSKGNPNPSYVVTIVHIPTSTSSTCIGLDVLKARKSALDDLKSKLNITWKAS